MGMPQIVDVLSGHAGATSLYPVELSDEVADAPLAPLDDTPDGPLKDAEARADELPEMGTKKQDMMVEAAGLY